MEMEAESEQQFAYNMHTPPPNPPRMYFPAGDRIDSNRPSVAFLEIPPGQEVASTATHQNRRARAKSGLAGLFVLMDLIYLIVLLTVSIPAMLYFLFDVKIKELGELNQLNNLTYCGSIDLAKQVEWIGFASVITYLLAVVSLIISVVTLSLTFCYGHVILKFINIVLMFSAITVHGYDCHAWIFYFRLGVFVVVHLPIQTLGFKVSVKFIRSILYKPSMYYEPSSINIPIRRTSSNSPTRRDSTAIKRTHSARRIATVD
ncbi:hypothetical protein Ocin01_06186 [Orchesella cincta]|uniref:Uncharacterized protein n=1 Tax=Orchesella cincta TaxID=48709 RepID=A0A1D2N5E5_ORCCI|nr:hypothetical protein Ocin01_06186 [Orchesella cincta]